MPRANGEFVKIYLYLLRSLQSGDTALDLAAVADVFDCTESAVLRTLRYWENQKLVVLAGTDTQPHRQTTSHPAHRRQPEHLSHPAERLPKQALSPLRQQGIKKQ